MQLRLLQSVDEAPSRQHCVGQLMSLAQLDATYRAYRWCGHDVLTAVRMLTAIMMKEAR